MEADGLTVRIRIETRPLPCFTLANDIRRGQLEIGLAVLRRRLYRAIVLAFHIRCELVQAGNGARRLLVGRFEALDAAGKTGSAEALAAAGGYTMK